MLFHYKKLESIFFEKILHKEKTQSVGLRVADYDETVKHCDPAPGLWINKETLFTMDIKLIFLDLDGTLLDSNKNLPETNRRALEQAAGLGVHIVPSTGRFYSGMPQVVRDLPFVRYVVAVNGAKVHDVKEDKVLYREEIPLETAFRVFDALDALPVIYDCYMGDFGYDYVAMYERVDEFISDPRVNAMVKGTRQPVPDLRTFLREQGAPLQKIQMFFKDMDRRAAELERMPRLFPELAVTSSIYNNIEMNAKTATKGEALRFLCRHLGIDIRDTMAFGDSSNDLSMIQAAGLGVAMGNAASELLAAADYITDTNDQNGVATALERFVLRFTDAKAP